MSEYIHVTVIAGARKEKVIFKKPQYFEVSVKEKAERNQANTRVIELIASHFGIPTSSVRIINGHTHPKKLLVCEIS